MAKLHIGPGRLSYPQLFERGSEEYGSKYGTALLLPPETDLQPIKHALLEAAIEKWGPDRDKWPKLRSTPATVIKKVEEKEQFAEFHGKGWHYINLSSKDQPGIVDSNLKDVTDPREAYPGRWAVVSVNAYPWDNQFGKGVSLGLNNVQLRKHDDQLGGKPRAQDEFAEWAEEMPSDSPPDSPKKPEPKKSAPQHDDWGD